MPYKDKRLADLQRQRWAETHPEYRRRKSAEIEKKNKRWLRPDRKEYMRQWWKDHPEKRRLHNERYRFHHAADVKKRKQEYYQRNRERLLEKQKKYFLEHREELLPKFKAYGKKNRYRHKELQRIAYHRDIEKSRAKGRAETHRLYYRNHEKNKAKKVAKEAKRRTWIATGIDSKENIEFCIWKLRTDPDATCSYCGKSIAGEVQIDHVIPLSRGGKHRIANICGSCKTCNISKGNRTLAEWSESKRLERNY